ncbi:MAG: TRAP transporter small permease subunit [Pseudomonadota bacterium]|uniref:TRAP transporter small permease subunit n=1 Tax=Fodinicurvata fenggangensis TaxID=1121830 RepID=UPI00047EAFD4|nr:TRAP transporter small permease subunit [Fodinicurvata fenggangensis]
MSFFKGIERVGRALGEASAWPGRLASWLILPVIVAALWVVIGSLFGVGTIAQWNDRILLFSNQLNLTGLVELQWHLFAVMIMLGGAYALRENHHVRVDLIYANVGQKWRRIIDIVGDLVLLLPYCALIAWLSLGFVDMAYRSGEGSDYGGLADRYLVKSVLTIGLCMLFLAGLGRILENLGALLSGSDSEQGRGTQETNG